MATCIFKVVPHFIEISSLTVAREFKIDSLNFRFQIAFISNKLATITKAYSNQGSFKVTIYMKSNTHQVSIPFITFNSLNTVRIIYFLNFQLLMAIFNLYFELDLAIAQVNLRDLVEVMEVRD